MSLKELSDFDLPVISISNFYPTILAAAKPASHSFLYLMSAQFLVFSLAYRIWLYFTKLYKLV